jgi:hypothetical protein
MFFIFVLQAFRIWLNAAKGRRRIIASEICRVKGWEKGGLCER